jgi:hypothetical protein
MTQKDFELKYIKGEPRERVKGRFHSSEISAIIKGYLKPEDFFKEKPINQQGRMNIITGFAFERMEKDILEYNGLKFKWNEPKESLKIDDYEIVAVPDFNFKDYIIECKCPQRKGTPEDYLERYKHQLECQYRIFKKPIKLMIGKMPFEVEHLLEYKPSDKLWSEIKEKLADFHDNVADNKGQIIKTKK